MPEAGEELRLSVSKVMQQVADRWWIERMGGDVERRSDTSARIDLSSRSDVSKWLFDCRMLIRDSCNEGKADRGKASEGNRRLGAEGAIDVDWRIGY